MKLFGKNSCLEAIKAGIKVEEVYLFDKIEESFKNEILQLVKNANIKFCNKDLLNKMCDFKNHQGIVIFCENFKYTPLENILEKNIENNNFFAVLLNGIEDPQNLGNIIRTCECAGVDCVIIPKNRACKINDTVFKVSAGAISHINVCEVTNLNDAIKLLKKNNVFVFGLEACGEKIYNANLTGKIGLVVGSEGKGLGELVKKNCDGILSIPLKGKVNSLNASNAAAIGIFEVIRQRENEWKRTY